MSTRSRGHEVPLLDALQDSSEVIRRVEESWTRPAFREGDVVEAKFGASSHGPWARGVAWYRGKVTAVHPGRICRYDIEYDDGDEESDVLGTYMRKPSLWQSLSTATLEAAQGAASGESGTGDSRSGGKRRRQSDPSEQSAPPHAGRGSADPDLESGYASGFGIGPESGYASGGDVPPSVPHYPGFQFKGRRACGTPGCTLHFCHAGMCSHLTTLGRRPVKPRHQLSPEQPERALSIDAPGRPGSRGLSLSGTTSEGSSERRAIKTVRPGANGLGAAPSSADEPHGRAAYSGWDARSLGRLVHKERSKAAEELQVECERCGKWRTLPAGTHVDEAAEWACAMHPTCSISCTTPEGIEDELDRVVAATWAFVGECPSIGGLGLYARADLAPGQAIAEYFGPRVADTARLVGAFVLRVPRTRVSVDGHGDNSPFECPRSPAIFANHSSCPNAALQCWPSLDAAREAAEHGCTHELQNTLWLVAKEPIPAGCEIRINYEDGGTKYWHGLPPQETNWREARAALMGPPVPADAVPAIDVLTALSDALSRCSALPVALADALDGVYMGAPAPLLPAERDRRVAALARCLVSDGDPSSWGLLATHVPGYSGRVCHERWRELRMRALQPDVPPLGFGRELEGRWVLVPRSEWPDEPCADYDGRGWAARIVTVRHMIVDIRCWGYVYGGFREATVRAWTPIPPPN